MKYEKAINFGMKQYEKYVLSEDPKEAISAARPAREQAKVVLNTAIAEKKAYEGQYQMFCKLMKVSRKEVPLSEIMECIAQIVVDTDRRIVVKWM